MVTVDLYGKMKYLNTCINYRTVYLSRIKDSLTFHFTLHTFGFSWFSSYFFLTVKWVWTPVCVWWALAQMNLVSFHCCSSHHTVPQLHLLSHCRRLALPFKTSHTVLTSVSLSACISGQRIEGKVTCSLFLGTPSWNCWITLQLSLSLTSSFFLNLHRLFLKTTWWSCCSL